MIHNKIHLICPVSCPRPSIALQVQSSGLKHQSIIHSFAFTFVFNFTFFLFPFVERDFEVSVTCEECIYARRRRRHGNGNGNVDGNDADDDDDDDDEDDCRTTFCFRAPTAELKHTWENIVDQRIVACKTQPDRDNMFGKVLAEFI